MGRSARAAANRPRSVPKLLSLTLLGALLPGLGLIVGGRRRIGAFVLTLALGLVGLGVYVGLTRREQVLAAAVVPSRLLMTSVAIGVLAFLWIMVIVASHRSLRPATGGRGGRAIGAVFVGVLCFAIAAPAALGVQSVLAQRDPRAGRVPGAGGEQERDPADGGQREGPVGGPAAAEPAADRR